MTTRRRQPAKAAAPKKTPSLFFSRDESWMRFNQRVLEEAQDATNPLLERVKFLAITASNLDEFVEIRVASLLQRIEDGHNETQAPDEGGLTLIERLDGPLHDAPGVRRQPIQVLERPDPSRPLRRKGPHPALDGA